MKAAQKKLRNGESSGRPQSGKERSLPKLKGSQSASYLPEIKADASKRGNSMAFAPHIPGSATKKKRLMLNSSAAKFPSMTEAAKKQLDGEDKKLEKENPDHFNAKLGLIVKADAAKKQEQTLQKELKH